MLDCEKCKLYLQNLSFAEEERRQLQKDYEAVSDNCHRLLEELSHFIIDESGKILPGRGQVANQVIKAVRFGMIKGKGLPKTATQKSLDI